MIGVGLDYVSHYLSVPVFLGVLILTLILLEYWNVPENLPPGPVGIPYLGYLPFLGFPPHVKLQQIAKKYGKICSFYLGRNLIIMLSDYEVLKEALVKQGDNFSGRPESFPFRLFPQDKGIVTCEGAEFKTMKTFILSTLKDAGGVKERIENIIKDNIEDFIHYLNSLDGKASDVLEPLGLTVALTYSQLMLNKRFPLEDPWFRQLIDTFYREQRFYGNGIKVYLPWTKKIPVISKLVGEDDAKATRRLLYKLLDKEVQECEASYVEGSKDNFVHAWITQSRIWKAKHPNDVLFTRENLFPNINLVFAAGYETTTTTLMWALIFLVKNPHVQEKLQKEIDEVLGDRTPSIFDADRMQYTMAALLEIHRCATIGPLGIQHSNLEETTLCGYTIPKRSYILTNFMAVHFDPKNFPEPKSFKPERFMDANGRFKKSEKVVNFSMGKRQCPGESLAGVEVFHYVVTLLQHFSIVKPDNEEISDYRSDSLSANPNRFKVRFITRQAAK